MHFISFFKTVIENNCLVWFGILTLPLAFALLSVNMDIKEPFCRSVDIYIYTNFMTKNGGQKCTACIWSDFTIVTLCIQ